MAELRSNIDWKRWGRDDPLYGVALQPKKQKGSPTAWTDDELYAMGESLWDDFFRQWQQYGVDTASCIDVGCGVGRITKYLALTFNRVYAVDISEDMIRYARTRIKAKNVQFSIVDGIHLPLADCSVNSLFSSYVLQQVDSIDIGLSCFREFFRVLDFGGTMMVQLPLYEWPTDDPVAFTKLLKALYRFRLRASTLRAEVKRLTGVKTRRDMHYPIRRLRRALMEVGYKGIEFRFIPVSSDGSLPSFVLATK